MAWKDKPLGIVINSSMNPDFVKLKEQGLSFVVIEAGTGLIPAPAFAEQFNKAHAAGLPIMAMWIPVPAYDNYVYEQPAKEQVPVILKALAGREIRGIIISAERWWIGMDRENGKTLRPATGNAISYTSNEIIRALVHNFPGMPVLCRSNDGFAKKYSSEMTVWTDQYPFYLADWRYRIRAADGTYTAYTFAPKLTALSLADVLAAMPTDDCKNPLIPGNTPTLKF